MKILKKTIAFLLFIFVFCLAFSGCSDSQDTPDFQYETADKMINVSFKLGNEYKGINPQKDLSSEEYAKRKQEASSAHPIAHYEIYKNDKLIFQLYFTGLDLYEQKKSKAKEGNQTPGTSVEYTVIEEKSNNLYEYIFYYEQNKDNEELSGYYYLGKFLNVSDLGFSAYSNSSQEEIESIFSSMKIWTTKTS